MYLRQAHKVLVRVCHARHSHSHLLTAFYFCLYLRVRSQVPNIRIKFRQEMLDEERAFVEEL